MKHDVYLSDFALRQLMALKETKTSDWIVPNRSSTGPVNRQVLTKQVTNRQQPPFEKNHLHNSKTLVLLGGRWVIHDLRRTAGKVK